MVQAGVAAWSSTFVAAVPMGGGGGGTQNRHGACESLSPYQQTCPCPAAAAAAAAAAAFA
jgi:hypothetical protein